MKTQNLILVFVTMGSAVCILSGLVVLFRRALHAAKTQMHKISTGGNNDAIQWNETGAVSSAKQNALSRISQALSTLSVKAVPMKVLSITDPVDGTTFQDGETIIRCACGTNYHQHSWQWLMEKASGKCVNCKRLVAQQEMLA
ncbi:MAG TPA: hypothetical protein VFB79_18540 [Candidatus Angelobacter sp.]|nr:hypothetical protein [Candidatus Angelobacter sp.]